VPHPHLNNLGEEGLKSVLDDLQIMRGHITDAWDSCPVELEFMAGRAFKIRKKIDVLIKEVKERISACSE